MSPVEKRVGLRFAEARRAAGLTQEQVAEEIGCSVETIGRLERGAQMPSMSRLDRAARFIGIDVAQLVMSEPRSHHDAVISRIVAILRQRSIEDVELVAEILERIFSR